MVFAHGTSRWADSFPIITEDLSGMLRALSPGQTLSASLSSGAPFPSGPSAPVIVTTPVVRAPARLSPIEPSLSQIGGSDRVSPLQSSGGLPSTSPSIATADLSPNVPPGITISTVSGGADEVVSRVQSGLAHRPRRSPRYPSNVASPAPTSPSVVTPDQLELTPEQEAERKALYNSGIGVRPSGWVAVNLVSLYLPFPPMLMCLFSV